MKITKVALLAVFSVTFSAFGQIPVGPMSAAYFTDINFTCDSVPAGAKLVRMQPDRISGINATGHVTRDYRIENKFENDDQSILSGYGLIVSNGPVADSGCSSQLNWTLTIQNTNGQGLSPSVLKLHQVDACPGWPAPKIQDNSFPLNCRLN